METIKDVVCTAIAGDCSSGYTCTNGHAKKAEMGNNGGESCRYRQEAKNGGAKGCRKPFDLIRNGELTAKELLNAERAYKSVFPVCLECQAVEHSPGEWMNYEFLDMIEGIKDADVVGTLCRRCDPDTPREKWVGKDRRKTRYQLGIDAIIIGELGLSEVER